MFLGEYKHSIDIKGRLAVPAKFRDALKSGAIVTRGLDRCLWLFEKSEWGPFAEKVKSLPIVKSDNRAFARLMLAGAMEVEFDAQGRILLPDYLREYAGLKKMSVIAGLHNRLEIWDEANWEKDKAKTESSGNEIAERLDQLGI